jgi:hypothetical protein
MVEILQDEEAIIAELNDKHAVVMVGGKCVIANEQINPTFERADITFSPPKSSTSTPILIRLPLSAFVFSSSSKIPASTNSIEKIYKLL